MNESVTIRITQQADYQFLIDFGAALPALLADEAPPVGEGLGPQPEHLLLAGVANCLSASLLFALRKFKQDPGRVTAIATARLGRNERNRTRITRIGVDLTLGVEASRLEHLDRVLTQFEDFCTVTQSVQAGVPVEVTVTDGSGQRLK
jgi:uncharacterized OsmC-like protein